MAYSFVKQIIIDHTKVPNTDLSNFPFLFSGTFAYLKTVANGGSVQNASGFDIIFSSTSDLSGSGKIDFELASWDASTGAIQAWVKVSSLSHTVDTTIYILYGDSGISTDQSNKNGVWDSNYVAVYHLEESFPANAADSTSNANTLDDWSGNPSSTALGAVGKAWVYNFWQRKSSITGLASSGAFTLEVWAKFSHGLSNSWFFGWGEATNNRFITLMQRDNGSGGDYIGFEYWSGHYARIALPAAGTWYHLVAVMPSGGANVSDVLVYLNSSLQSPTVVSDTAIAYPNTSLAHIALGSLPGAENNGNMTGGSLDEARISKTARSADWIAASYNNQSDPATFFSVSDVTVPLTITKSDTVNNFVDVISISFVQAQHLGVVKSDALNFQDGISLTGPPPDYFLLLGDSIANIQDSAAIVVELQKTFSDSVDNLADAFASMVGIPIEVFDSQQFNWQDAISVSFGAPLSLSVSDSINNYADFVSLVLGVVRIDITTADTINNLADAIRLNFLLRIVQGDNFTLSDTIRMRFNHLLGIADALGITDAILTDIGSRPAFSDSINNLADSVSIALAANLSITKGDQLNLTDAVSLALDGVYNQTGFIDRVRRYLGDIQSS